MNSPDDHLIHRTGVWVILLLLMSPLTFASGQEATTGPQQLPNSPGTVRAQSTLQTQVFSKSAAIEPEQKSEPQEPVGTAAAEAPITTGVAASQPAGAAIAPAKQRRVRILMIKVGALVGAGAAIGAVAALSSGSPSRPPGSH